MKKKSEKHTHVQNQNVVNKDKKEKKPRAKTAYNFFVSENMKKLMEIDEWKDKKNSEMMKECGSRWMGLSIEDKAPYKKLSDEHKALLASQQEDRTHPDDQQ